MYQIVVFACCEIIRNGDKSRRVSRYFVGLRLMRDGTRHGCCSPSRLTEWNSSANTCKYHLVRMLEQLMIAEMSGCSSPSCQGGCREMNQSIFIFRFFSIGHSQTIEMLEYYIPCMYYIRTCTDISICPLHLGSTRP